MLPPKSREHRIRVLENQAKLAAEKAAQPGSEPQLRMPLLVEVKCNAAAKPQPRRSRSRSRTEQPDLGDL